MSANTPENPQQTHTPLNPLGTEEGVVLLARQKKNTAILWGITVLLIVLAAAVFLVLPNFVSPPDLTRNTPAPAASVSAGSSGSARSAGTAEALSPFEEAQRLRQREAAQAVLADLLNLQEKLEERRIADWAPDEYASALTKAGEGDSSYREQKFTEATASYQAALSSLQQLEAGIPSRLDTLITNGNSAIARGNSVEALERFELALNIDPASDAAVNGIERARVLDRVLALLDTARDQAEDRDFEAARDSYRSARDLDAENTAASEGIQAMSTAILERDFQQLMSQGYTALQADNLTQAKTRFEQALALKPGAPEATTALVQVNDQSALDTISRHMSEARGHVQNEEWKLALDAWNAALAVDPAIVDARNGRNEAQSRLNLDNFLKSLLADPLALADSATYQQSLDVYTNTLRIPDGGPRLREQMRQAKDYLEQVRIPRNVTLISDGQTTVTLLRVEPLGQFDNRTLSLTPGRYAATGIRNGYQDVRVEFVVPFDTSPQPVTVAATESIR